MERVKQWGTLTRGDRNIQTVAPVFRLTRGDRNIQTKPEPETRSNNWLQKFIGFNTTIFLTGENKKTAQRLYNELNKISGYKTGKKIADFETLIANLLNQQSRPIGISLNKNDYKINRYNKVSYSVTKNLPQLFNSGFINMEKGFKTEEVSRKTRIWTTKKLLDLFPLYANSVQSKPLELVILRNDKKKEIEYKDTAETWRIRAILERVNEVNSKADIICEGYKLNASLVAIFTRKFSLYGRLHTRGYKHYQGLPGDIRKIITINNDEVVELDFRGLHPCMLYASVGIQYTEDPYTAIDSRPEVRKYLKHILITLINCKNDRQAEQAANNYLFENHVERERLSSLGITRAKPLIEAFKQVHSPIAQYFCGGADTGLRIMNQDSKIALTIIDHFAKKDIPILCLHDSFIVQKQYKDELYQVMKDTYKRYTKYEIQIK